MIWQEQAACRGVPTYIFFPKNPQAPGAYDEARKVCAGCPVAEECLGFALRTQNPRSGTDHGMFGGTTPAERARLRRGRRWCVVCQSEFVPAGGNDATCSAECRRETHPHGSTTRYAYGCACAECRAANTAASAARRRARP